MTFPRTPGRTFEPTDEAILVSTADGKSPVTNPNYSEELAAYKRDREINILMRQRHGVNL